MITEEQIQTGNDEKSFAEQVDDILSGTANVYDNLKVCDTPKILLDAGCNQLPMLYTQQHLRDAVKPKSAHNPHLHGLTTGQIKRIPQLLENPAILFDSISPHRSGNGSIIAVLNEVDNDNAPIIVSIKPDGRGIYQLERVESNFITSIYGKDRGFANYIERAAESGNVLYWNKSKSQELFLFQGLQLPEALNNLDFDIIIRQSQNIINTKTQKSLPEPQKEVTLVVAECREFHSYGVCYDGIETVDEAIEKFRAIPPERLNAVPSIGINIHKAGTENCEDIQVDIATSKCIDLEFLKHFPDIVQNKKAVETILEIMDKMPDVGIVGDISVIRRADALFHQDTIPDKIAEAKPDKQRNINNSLPKKSGMEI